MNRRWMVALVAGVLVVGGGLFVARQSLVSLWSRPEPMDVRIGVSATLSPALVWIARDLGFFEQAGVTATIKEYGTGKGAAQGMMAGEVDISSAAEFLLAKLSFETHDVRILATLAVVHQIKMIGSRDRGIAELADFKGKRVGVTLGTNGEYFLARLLTLNGLERTDIVWVDMAPKAMAAAMASGEVDGVLTWAPFVQKVQAALGDAVVTFDGQPGQDYYYLLMARPSWLATHGESAWRVMTALRTAEEWVSTHPLQANAYMADKFALRPEEVASTLEGYRFTVSLPHALLVAIETEARWLEGLGQVKGARPVDYRDLIHDEPLTRVAPTSVTIR